MIMSLIKWSPFFLEPFDDADALWNDMRQALAPLQKMTPASGGGLVPPVDIYEDGDAFVVEASMPGIDSDKIELSISQGTLLIKAASERKTEVDEKNYYRKEVRHGLVFRKVPLPAPVQEDRADARYDNGVLKVRLPKRAESTGTIKVEVKKTLS